MLDPLTWTIHLDVLISPENIKTLTTAGHGNFLFSEGEEILQRKQSSKQFTAILAFHNSACSVVGSFSLVSKGQQNKMLILQQ